MEVKSVVFCDISKTSHPSPPNPNKVEFEHHGLSESFCWPHHCWKVGIKKLYLILSLHPKADINCHMSILKETLSRI